MMKRCMDVCIAALPPFAQPFVITTVLTVTETPSVAFLGRVRRKDLILFGLACRAG